MEATIDQQTLTISFERSLAASPAEVFDAWTHPEQVAQWWDPTGTPLRACESDLRPEGAFRFENGDHSPPFTGVYKVVERPTRLVFEALGSVGTVSLRAEGEKTRMRVTIRCASQEHLEHFVRLGVATNTDRTLDNLVCYVAARARSRAS